jgi:hypothetical protein
MWAYGFCGVTNANINYATFDYRKIYDRMLEEINERYFLFNYECDSHVLISGVAMYAI